MKMAKIIGWICENPSYYIVINFLIFPQKWQFRLENCFWNFSELSLVKILTNKNDDFWCSHGYLFSFLFADFLKWTFCDFFSTTIFIYSLELSRPKIFTQIKSCHHCLTWTGWCQNPRWIIRISWKNKRQILDSVLNKHDSLSIHDIQ